MEIIKKNNNQSSKLAIGLLTFFVSIIALVEVFHALSKWNNNKSEKEMKINNINEMIDVDELAEALKNPEQVESMKKSLQEIKDAIASKEGNNSLSQSIDKIKQLLDEKVTTVDKLDETAKRIDGELTTLKARLETDSEGENGLQKEIKAVLQKNFPVKQIQINNLTGTENNKNILDPAAFKKIFIDNDNNNKGILTQINELLKNNNTTLSEAVKGNNINAKLDSLLLKLQKNNDTLSDDLSRIVAAMGGEDKTNIEKYAKEIKVHKVGDKEFEGYKRMDELTGLDEEKKAFNKLQAFMHYNIDVQKLKIPVATGAILHGVPGTGKTTLARALAKTTGFDYIEIDGTEFQKYNTREGINRVHALFKRAEESQNIIICVDECENTWRDLTIADNPGTRAITTTFKAELTKFSKDYTKNIFWIGTTNHIECIDEAILSRFNHKIEVKPLDLQARKIFLIMDFLTKQGWKKKQTNLTTGKDELLTAESDQITDEAINYLENGFVVELEKYPELQSFRAMINILHESALTAIIRTRKSQTPSKQKIMITETDIETCLKKEIQELENRKIIEEQALRKQIKEKIKKENLEAEIRRQNP
ncbi:ATP-binding protein [Candidatus Phytoplasma pruni]|uniref:ATP-binding protein n=1 Tax=Candidatus Phytoplasma pruni TaxID=479893 RepID=A0A851HDV7_9MOLU|nr:ATP-binding protein [Candidatus Phytoplasma pruni]NWN46138.1 ATP-binding protein [Candidatus Phytoplasma pruni]